MKLQNNLKKVSHAFFAPITILHFAPDPQFIGYLWLIAGLILLMLELTTPGLFFFISFAIGCSISALVAFFGFSFTVQCLAGLTASGIAVLVMRSYFVKKKTVSFKTNMDALLHQTGMVTVAIEPKKHGRIKIRGEEWPAVTDEPKILQKGTIVTVVRIDGNKVIIR